MTATVTRSEIVRAARSWIGTPYHHQASCKGIGVDCLGLVRGVWRDVFGSDCEAPPSYTRDWAEASGVETMLIGAAQHLRPADANLPQPGDVLIFRLRAGCVAKHAGIVSNASTMIHAMEGGPVTEVALSQWWMRRVAAAFQFPHLEHGG
jgi:NlpC/P60 family putative phage cell wall peptidase